MVALTRNVLTHFGCKSIYQIFLPMLLISSFSLSIYAQETDSPKTAYEDVPEFGGPSSVSGGLKEDAMKKEPALRFEGLDSFFKPYFDSKTRVNKDMGLAYGFDYTAMYQSANESLGEESAGGGIFRAFGSWTVAGRETGNTGSIVYKVENRHKFGTDIPPKDLGFEIGYVGFTAPIYADYEWGLTNLYWQQKLAESKFNIIAGVVDATDYLDIYGLINPWTSFSNLAFLTDPTIPAPNQGLGAAFGWMVSDNIYIVGGLADTNGDPSEPGDMWDSFFDDHEYFTHLEVGWTTSYKRRYLDNINLTYWHADERVNAATPDGWGVAFSYATFIDEKWMPFLRVGYAEDGGALYENSVALGFGYYAAGTRDLLGFGLNWSEPSESSFAPGLDDQYTAEFFYRYQLAQHLAITPDIQFIKDPALNPEEDQIVVFGLRARLDL